MTVRAELRSIEFDPEPTSLPADAESFAFLVRLFVGPEQGQGEESFDLTVCSPEWVGEQCRRTGFFDGRHHVVVDVQQFDQRALRSWLETRVRAVSGENWNAVGEKVGRLGFWEFEDYQP